MAGLRPARPSAAKHAAGTQGQRAYGHLFALDASDHERLDAAELRVIGAE